MFKFEWSERDVGYALGFVGVMITLVQGLLIRVVIPRLGERRAVYNGYLLLSVGFLGFAFAPNGWIMLACVVPWSIGEIATPALRGIIANEVPNNAQGELQGALTSVASLTMIGRHCCSLGSLASSPPPTRQSTSQARPFSSPALLSWRRSRSLLVSSEIVQTRQ